MQKEYSYPQYVAPYIIADKNIKKVFIFLASLSVTADDVAAYRANVPPAIDRLHNAGKVVFVVVDNPCPHSLKNAKVIENTVDVFCPKDACPMFNENGIPLYFDDVGHLSRTGGILLAEQVLKPCLPKGKITESPEK